MVWRFSDVLQNAAEAGGYLMVTADGLHILAVVADVEVVDCKVDQHGLITRSPVELGKASLILRRPRVILWHETAQVFLALGYGLLAKKTIWRSSDSLLQLDDLVVLHG